MENNIIVNYFLKSWFALVQNYLQYHRYMQIFENCYQNLSSPYGFIRDRMKINFFQDGYDTEKIKKKINLYDNSFKTSI